MQRWYIAIDLKSFFASVECVARGLNPLDANLVVADEFRTEKTICLAVSPALKSYGIPGRARLFEVIQKVGYVNRERMRTAPDHRFTGKSIHLSELNADPALEIDYVIAPPRMSKYMEISTKVYDIYLKYVAPEDIVAYSVDEVFIDVTKYLALMKTTPREMAMTMIRDVLRSTGITATAGIGPNLFLCKIAMDIEAKHIEADADGVRIAELTERSFREKMWDHRPITDFWRIGKGTAKRLEEHFMYTLGDVALMSVQNEELLYKLFGINAELLIDHAWGWEPCRIEDIKAYRPEENSINLGQVLQEPYTYEKAEIIVREMTESLTLELMSKGLVSGRVDLLVVYDVENLKRPAIREKYRGPIVEDPYGRTSPKPAHGTRKLPYPTASTRVITDAMLDLYHGFADKELLIRRIYVTVCGVTPASAKTDDKPEQLDMFTDYEALEGTRQKEQEKLKREEKMQRAMLSIKQRYGKNAILRAVSYMEGATARERNRQIGGHRAGETEDHKP